MAALGIRFYAQCTFTKAHIKGCTWVDGHAHLIVQGTVDDAFKKQRLQVACVEIARTIFKVITQSHCRSSAGGVAPSVQERTILRGVLAAQGVESVYTGGSADEVVQSGIAVAAI